MTALLWVILIGGVLVMVGGLRLLGIVLGALLLLGVAGGMYIWKKNQNDAEAQRRRNESVRIEWVPAAAVTDRLGDPPDPYLSVNDTLPALSFRVCNDGPETVSHVELRPQTWHPDRSTAYDVVLAEYWSDRTLWSDYYLAPGECNTIAWQGQFQVFHRIEARSVDVTTEER